jgi:hypothetical protein
VRERVVRARRPHDIELRVEHVQGIVHPAHPECQWGSCRVPVLYENVTP